MRSSTIFLQLICAALGILFIATGIFISDHVLIGGLLLGSIMCIAAAFLGADHTTNRGSSRGVFKTLAVIASLPIIGVGLNTVAVYVGASDWPSAIFTLLRISFLVAVLVLLLIDTTPAGQKFIQKIGLSRPSEPEK